MSMGGRTEMSQSGLDISSFVQEDKAELAKQLPVMMGGGGGRGGGIGGGVDASGKPVILQYAAYLGMDIAADTDLLWIAQQALVAELPPGWTEHADPMSGDAYFHNAQTGETVWEHPCDSYYRNLYDTLKAEKAAKSSTAAFADEGAGGFTQAELSMAIGTNIRVAGAQSTAAVTENRYLAPIAKAEGEIREREDRRKEKEARREERRIRTETKKRKRQEKSARKIQRAFRCHRFRVHFAIFMEQRVAVTKVQARWRGILYRRRMREMLIEQIRHACAIRLQAVTRGGLLR